MKPIKIDLSADFREIKVVPVSDYHFGDPHSDHKKILQEIEYIKNNDDVFFIMNGDILDCAIASSIGDTYASLYSPMDELKACEDLFAPIAHKCLCIVQGNHELRHYRTNGISMTEIFAKQLKIEDRYSPTTAFLFLRFGRLAGGENSHGRKVAYTFYVCHGNGGGKKVGGKLQRLSDLSTIADADCYICGHTHLPAVFKDRFARPNMANSSITYCDKLYINVSAKLNYGGYGDYGGFKPASTDTPVIILNGCKKEMKAVL